MLLQAIIASIGGSPDASYLRAYLVFITPATVVFLILRVRGGRYAGWGLLIPAFGAEQAADCGLTSHWYYVVTFVVATFLT